MWLLVSRGIVITKDVDFLGKDSSDLTWLEVVVVMVAGCGALVMVISVSPVQRHWLLGMQKE